MSICYWCCWGWPKPILDIYNDALNKLDGNERPLHYGPSHIVWEDENWDSAQWCLDHLEDDIDDDITDSDMAIIRESLERLLAVPDEFKHEPEEYDGENPLNFPPPGNWKCKQPA